MGIRVPIRDLNVSYIAGRLVITETKQSVLFSVVVMTIVGGITVIWFRAWGGDAWLTDPVFFVPLACFLGMIIATITHFLKTLGRPPMLVFDRDTNVVQRYGRPLCSLSDVASVTITFCPASGGGRSPSAYALHLVLTDAKQLLLYSESGDDQEISCVAQAISQYAGLGNPVRQTAKIYTEFHLPWPKKRHLSGNS